MPSLRPLTLAHPPSGASVSVPVPDDHEAWMSAETLRDAFGAWLERDADAQIVLHPIAAADEDDDELTPAAREVRAEGLRTERDFVLLALFLRYVAGSLDDSTRGAHNAVVLQQSASYLLATYLAGGTIDLHNRVKSFEPDRRRVVIRSWSETDEALRSRGLEVPVLPVGKLFAEAKGRAAVVEALFGGQGTNETYFDELQVIFELYAPFITPLLRCASELLCALATKHNSSLLYAHSMDALGWLVDPSTRPPVPYLATCAASLPLIGLTQFAQWIATARSLAFSPAQFRDVFAGATGHSQGVVTACAVAYELAADDWPSFEANALEALRVLFYIGLRGTEAFPPMALNPTVVAESVKRGEGAPTPMLAVTGLQLAPLQKKIDATNAHLERHGKGTVAISLFNGARAYVVTGPPESLAGLAHGLRQIKAEAGKDQSKIPHSKRQSVFSLRFLSIPVPYHNHHYLAGCAEQVASHDLADADAFWSRSKLSMAIHHTDDGHDLRKATGPSLLRELCDQIFDRPIRWVTATDYSPATTHVLDFGPGGPSGIGSLTARNLEGRGIRCLAFAGTAAAGRGGDEAYDVRSLRTEQAWGRRFAPKLVKTADGRIRLDTPFSRLLSKPPLMVAGMTPCTVGAGFNAAVLNAGYHIELAGGGHYNARALRAKVDDIAKRLEHPGLGLTLNALFINQRQFTFQLPTWCEMRQEGLPVEGFCVAAGIPSTDKATEIITTLRQAGIKHVSFKPGSVEGIRQVANIAASNPDFPVILQWTGGRAGGHHSCEDVFAPMLATYGTCRQHKNLILLAGSGLGGADDAWPWLSGQWSVPFGAEPMPFDGLLYASRVMVAAEAHTSLSVKQLIVDTPGVGDDKWEGTYDKPTGGILTVRSELGEPIHKIATRGVKLWREFDDTVFGLPREKRQAWLDDHRAYVIDRLNKDFQKPWFPRKADGSSCELGEMTYAETLERMVTLLYIAAHKRWVDRSLRDLTGDWIRRIEERLSDVNGRLKVSELQSYSELDEPRAFLDRFFAKYPSTRTQIINASDALYFLSINQRPGQKPVPYIPVLDSSFEVWFKKDSLWQAEMIEAVVDQDPQRVCVLQGPVAVKHSTRVDEPIKEMFDKIDAQLIDRVLATFYDGDVSRVPFEEYLAAKPSAASHDVAGLAARYNIEHSVRPQSDGKSVHVYQLDGVLPPRDDWLDALAGPHANWLRALLTSDAIVQADRNVPNPAKALFRPRVGQRIEVTVSNAGAPVGMRVYGGIRAA